MDGSCSDSPVKIFAPSEPWEGTIAEAPDMIEAWGIYWLFFSGNWYYSASYGIGVAACQSPFGPCSDPDPASLHRNQSPGAGPGEQSLFRDGNNVYLLYNPFRANDPGPVISRPVAMARLGFTPQGPVPGRSPDLRARDRHRPIGGTDREYGVALHDLTRRAPRRNGGGRMKRWKQWARLAVIAAASCVLVVTVLPQVASGIGLGPLANRLASSGSCSSGGGSGSSSTCSVAGDGHRHGHGRRAAQGIRPRLQGGGRLPRLRSGRHGLRRPHLRPGRQHGDLQLSLTAGEVADGRVL